jgi:dihydroneopterin aldolase
MSMKIIIRDLRLDMLIGIHDHEKEKPQPVLLNIEAEIEPPSGGDSIDGTVCYSTMIRKIQELAGRGHINLVETLAENIAGMLMQDARIRNILVRVEKTAVYNFAAAVGVEVRKSR